MWLEYIGCNIGYHMAVRLASVSEELRYALVARD
jgi:hypothetical protein